VIEMRRSILVLLIGGVLASGYLALVPPRAAESPRAPWASTWPVVKGAYHIHTERSDGTGTIDEIAEAAARAGLQFVIITDHGDGTRAPDPPAYRAGVLCIDAVEVSTTYGHLTALALPQMPYRLAGAPRDVIEDVQRFGGFAIAAHPGSPKAALQWHDWDAPFDGLEWLNADSEWRDELWGSLGRVLLTYPVRPAETLATLLDRPDAVLSQWDRILRTRHVVGIAGADAHARLSVRSSSEPYEDRVIARLPSYDASFRAFANHVVLNAPFTGDAARDAAELLDAMRWGRMFTSIEGLARLGGFEVKASGPGGFHVARLGEYVESPAGVAFTASIAAPEGTRLVLLRDGEPMYEVTSDTLHVAVGADPAVYRFEAYLAASRNAPSIPWLVTNPIYVNLLAAHKPRRDVPDRDEHNRTHVAAQQWQAEASERSESTLSPGTLEDRTPVWVWRLRVADGPAVSQYAAIAFPVEQQLPGHRGVQLRARADRPMRIWAQLRAPGERGGRRWARSIHVSPTMGLVDLPFDEFRPVGPSGHGLPERPPLGDIDSLLLVADTLNTLPGTAATIAISDLWLVQ
jgi:hypothetical protein